MESEIRFIEIFPEHILLNHIKVTYENSFPIEERRDFFLLQKLISNEPSFSIYALMDDNAYVGFISSWRFDQFFFIEHFAIDEIFRSKSYGSLALKQYLKIAKNIVLEVEYPSDQLTKRRISFYECLGFVLDKRIYFQPPYRVGDKEIEMHLMAVGAIDLSTSFGEVQSLLYQKVYNVKRTDCL